MNFKIFYRSVSIVLLLLILGCVEPFEFKGETSGDALVVEATITNELKNQEILLSSSYALNAEGPAPESNAAVLVIDDLGNSYTFSEVSPGKYESEEVFQAEAGREYQLKIDTEDGHSYESDMQELSRGSAIDSLYAQRKMYEGKDGIVLQVNNLNPPDASRFYRFEYEETYKIVSPFTSIKDLEYINNEFVQVRKTREEEVCYNTIPSKDLVLASTVGLTDNDLEHFVVRFIEKGNPMIGHRYSILVRQFSISEEAYSYYYNQDKLAGSSNVFSQNQPGFVEGNIHSIEDASAKVLGFFSVSSVVSKRIFFNYEDFFTPEETRPEFAGECVPQNPLITPASNREAFVDALRNGRIKFLVQTNPIFSSAPYRVVRAECVDCNVFGTNVAPDFWEE